MIKKDFAFWYSSIIALNLNIKNILIFKYSRVWKYENNTQSSKKIPHFSLFQFEI